MAKGIEYRKNKIKAKKKVEIIRDPQKEPGYLVTLTATSDNFDAMKSKSLSNKCRNKYNSSRGYILISAGFHALESLGRCCSGHISQWFTSSSSKSLIFQRTSINIPVTDI